MERDIVDDEIIETDGDEPSYIYTPRSRENIACIYIYTYWQ
jgi:hypothetical protein